MEHKIITLWGFCKNYPEILNNVDIPSELNLDDIKNYIFMYAGNNECRYNDPDLLNTLVHTWFRSRKQDFSKMCEALFSDYNPIENYDRNDDFTVTADGKQNNTASGSDSKHNSGTRATESKTSAFNTNAYQPSMQETVTPNLTDTVNYGRKDEQTVHSETRNQGRSHGNIGVTTSQQMIQSELELRKFNVYKFIALEFEDEFTIPVYSKRCRGCY